ncbi:hypothetical protein PHJA_002632700 [Phtheirospermum japonicum]|uniref:S-protein homolog n=1 Tax=Phtheirospermum japonicum TaxID=374723 RepID=A0A830DD40_9LAMI|nr:hypothetical protein PHJA_002632700 [Phtheirospermum japonicum]
MNKCLLQYLVISCALWSTMASEKRACPFSHKFTVYVANNLPPSSAPLVVRCASKDDDLGNHTVIRNQDFHFDFCDNFWSTTLFFCHVWWGNKNIAFDAFRESWKSITCAQDDCYWAVKTDGIYYSNYYPPRGLKKRYSW